MDPINIKTWSMLLPIVLLAFTPSLIGAMRCSLIPEGINTPRSRIETNRYEIFISGQPKGYAPGETYTSRIFYILPFNLIISTSFQYTYVMVTQRFQQYVTSKNLFLCLSTKMQKPVIQKIRQIVLVIQVLSTPSPLSIKDAEILQLKLTIFQNQKYG